MFVCRLLCPGYTNSKLMMMLGVEKARSVTKYREKKEKENV